MVKAHLFMCFLALFGVWGVNSATPTAPAPTGDCNSVIISMTDCLSFVITQSTVKKPEGGCCAGLKNVLKTAPDCLCETFKNSGQLGISLNMTKAMTLPAACGVQAPSFSNCELSETPVGPPAHSPKSSPASHKHKPLAPSSTSTIAPTPANAPSAEGFTGTPGPAPSPSKKSGASATSVSFVVLVGMVIASCSHFLV